MPEHEAFLRHLQSHPYDPTSRLVFADWLEEHGLIGRAKDQRFVAGVLQKSIAKDLKSATKEGRPIQPERHILTFEGDPHDWIKTNAGSIDPFGTQATRHLVISDYRPKKEVKELDSPEQVLNFQTEPWTSDRHHRVFADGSSFHTAPVELADGHLARLFHHDPNGEVSRADFHQMNSTDDYATRGYLHDQLRSGVGTVPPSWGMAENQRQQDHGDVREPLRRAAEQRERSGEE